MQEASLKLMGEIEVWFKRKNNEKGLSAKETDPRGWLLL